MNKRGLLKKQSKKNYYGGTNFDLIDNEEALACFVHSDKNVLRFAFKIMYNTIKTAHEIGIKQEDIIYAISEHTLADPTLVTKPGFTKEEATNIFNEVLTKDEDIVFSQMSETKFHQIMGSFYSFTINTNFILGIIEGNETLKKILMERIKKLFCLPNSYTDWDNIKTLLINENKWLYLDVFAYCSNCPQSLYRRNMLNLPYIRKKVSDIKAIAPEKCHKNIMNKETSKIVKGDSWYFVENDTFFAKILNEFHRKYIAGPSGSAVLAYIFIFTFLNFEKTLLNKIMLLSCIIGDYIPYYHSLTEILMTYTFEIDDEIDQKYDLSIDPVTFAKKLIKPYLANLIPVGGKNKTKKIMINKLKKNKQ